MAYTWGSFHQVTYRLSACREWLRGIEIEILTAKANKDNQFVFEKFSRVYIL